MHYNTFKEVAKKDFTKMNLIFQSSSKHKFTVIDGILKNMGMLKGNINIKNLEELEYFVISQIQKFKSEIVIINYSGDTLIPSKKINTILYHLYALSEMCKVTFNLVGSISPTVYFNSNRKIPIGNFFYFDGENNSQDVSYLKQLKSS